MGKPRNMGVNGVSSRSGVRSCTPTATLLLMLGLSSFLAPIPALGQLLPDATTGTQVQPDSHVRGLPSDLIEGGTIRRESLFHSFQEFNIDAGRGVYFVTPLDIANIFSRITGGNPSNIEGTLGVLGNANLFLLNPNGILFGPNATLDIPGSFTASTADAFQFADGLEFSATDPQAPPLLTLSITPGLQLGRGDIANAGSLGVPAGRQLTLQGRNITHTGQLIAPSGTVGLLGETIGLLEEALVDVSGPGGGGTVWIGGLAQGARPDLNALRTYIGPDARIIADALGAGDGGTVVIWSDQATGFYGDISARGGREGGFVEVSSDGHLIFRGAVDTTAPLGESGILLLDPATITVANGTADSAADGIDSFAGSESGLAGQILSAPLSALDDLGPTTLFESELEGLSGDTNVILQATDGITIEDLTDDQLRFSGGVGRIALVADANGDGVGDVIMLDLQDTLATNGRDLLISGANLRLGNLDTSVLSEERLTPVDVDAGGPIPASGTSGLASFTFTVPDGLGFLTDVDVRFSAAHTFDADLTVSLASPGGLTLTLLDGVGGGEDNFQDTVLDDGATTPIAQGAAPFAGRFQPEEDLSLFEGRFANGVWLLEVVDNFEFDAGELFQAGESAPWGTALGTQLLLTSIQQVQEGDGGRVNLLATGDIAANTILTSGIGRGNQGGTVDINAGGTISLSEITASGSGGGGDIFISGQGDILTGDLTTASATFSGDIDTLGGDGGDIAIATPLGNVNTGVLDLTTQSTSGENLIGGNGGDLSITTTSGDIQTLSLLTVARSGASGTVVAGDGGDISIATASGDVDLSAANIVLRSLSFGSMVTSGQGGDFSISTTSGDITLSDVNSTSQTSGTRNLTGGNGGAAIVSTRSGDIEVTGSIDSGSITNGSSADDVIGGVSGAISLSTETGDIDSRSPLLANSVTTSGTGSSVAGRGGQISLSTTAGDINVLSASSSSRATSSSGPITGQRGGNISLSSRSGDITVLSGLDSSSDITSSSGTLRGGNGGDITIFSDRGNLLIAPLRSVSLLNSSLGSAADGNGGDISISSTAGNIDVSTLQTFSFSDSAADDTTPGGEGGAVSIFSDQGDINLGNPIFAFSLATNGPAGNGGDLSLVTQQGTIFGGDSGILHSFAVSQNNAGSGDGGKVTLSANNQISSLDVFTVSSQAEAGDLDIVGFGDLFLLEEVDVVTSASVIIPNPLGPPVIVEVGGIGQSGDANLSGAGALTLSNSNIISTAQGILEAGNIRISSPGQVTLQGASQIVSNTNSAGTAGNINVDSDTGILLTGADTLLSALTNAQGRAGNVTLEAPEITLDPGAQVSVRTNAQGRAGDIALLTNVLTLAEGAEISASTARGAGGRVQVLSPEALTISGPGRLTVETTGSGNAGNIEIRTPQLTVTDGVDISAATFSDSRFPAGPGSAGGFLDPGDAGDIEIFADTFDLTNGARVQTNTLGIGDAGTIALNIRDTLSLDAGEIAANTAASSLGQGGSVRVNADTARLSNSRISVNSEGQGRGGDILVDAGLVALENGATISATTASTDGGNINLQAEHALILSDRSEINATAGTALAGGDGGNIDIDAEFVIALPEGQNRIVANAFAGDGGNINIVTTSLLGAEFLDISASSEFGLDGEVVIDSPDLDPARGIIELPANLADASNQIVNACAVGRQGQSQFVATGRGGLPTTPASQPTGFYVLPDLGRLSEEQPTQAAAQAYYQANYSQAVTFWTQAANRLSPDPDRLASTLSNLALGHHYLGNWQQAEAAIIDAQQLLTPETATPQVLAQVLNTRASLNLSRGQTQRALDDWQQAADLYRKVGDSQGYFQAQLNQVQTLQSLGFYRQAQAPLEAVNTALADQPPSPLKAMGLLTLSHSLRNKGDTVGAQQTLETALDLAQKLNQPALTSQILLNLGHTAQPDQALAYYEKAQAAAPTALTRFQAQISQLRLLATHNPSTAQCLWSDLAPAFQSTRLPVSRAALYAQLHLAHTLLRYDLFQYDLLVDSPERLLGLLNQVNQQAQALQDPIAQVYSLGYQGDLYAQAQQWPEAQAFTEKALRQAQALQAPEMVYPFALQLGRLQKAQGNRTHAMEAYSAAIDALSTLRKDLLGSSEEAQFTFRDDVEPVYREFIKLLLQSEAGRSPEQAHLKRARDLIEDLQVEEINDYFQDGCVQGSPAFADEVDPKAAVIYPILLDDRLDVIVSVAGQPVRHYSTAVSSDQVEQTVKQALGGLTSPLQAGRPSTTQQLQQLYDWIIGPAAADLAQQDVDSLVFVADGILRTMPLTTLHDGEQYLIEKYNVVLSPGLQLLDPRPLQRQDLQILAGGLSEARPGFPALPFVTDELQQVTTQIPNHQILLNENLTKSNLLNSLETVPAGVVHLATHGEFGQTAEDTFILTWEGKLTLTEISAALQTRNRTDISPVELLVFSACKTASGDSRAVLGIAGMAIRSGARSTLAGLWAINDQAAAAFMAEFYEALAQPGTTKAKAFRQAQLTLIEDSQLASPYYWSPFVLVGNWL
ncbi:MAG: CHAT domain-containing protein [Cyanobacteria bacterium J06635_1]